MKCMLVTTVDAQYLTKATTTATQRSIIHLNIYDLGRYSVITSRYQYPTTVELMIYLHS